MFGGSGFSMLAIPLAIGAIMTALRFWMFYAGTSAIRGARMSRIAESDGHLSFDERIAERMRELDRETKAANPAPAPFASPPTSGPTGSTRGFGRRQI
ncbi:hypothetical protein [Sphingomonas sp.]|uniref:hypothetical protein n=1 Tax=Sphingomonas sp. TaxID=28214 RepID=UPI00286ADF3A|nr:hypothetical protein [Sphingomonas sp.]